MTKTLATAALAATILAGCSSGPSRVKPPSISPSGAASQAMKDYDKDGDGFIAGSEIDASPGIKSAMATIDADKDGKVTADEIQSRIEAWQATRYGVLSQRCTFTMDGKPIDGATVMFDPEPFLGDNIKAATDVTSPGGMCSPSIPPEERPTKDTPAGMQLGLYRVRISKKVNGQESIPAQFNSETTVGQQIATDDPAVASQKVRFDLKSK
jgi:hypothetical protein